jgi:hypothetical protein
MSSDWTLALQAVLLLASVGFFGLSGLRAFLFRRAMVRGIYRSRALWSMTFALLFIPFEIALLYITGLTAPNLQQPPSFQQPLIVSVVVFVIAFNLSAFVFLDRTILAARELDFFHRDTLRYGTARKLVWPISTIGMFGTFLTMNSGIVSSIFGILWPAPLAYYSIALTATSLRVSDRTMRNYAKWFGLFTVALGATFLYGQLTPPSGSFPALIGGLVSSILYYRATVSLSPVGRLESGGVGIAGTTALGVARKGFTPVSLKK